MLLTGTATESKETEAGLTRVNNTEHKLITPLYQVCAELGRIIQSTTGRPPGADELLPLFVYVVACAQAPIIP